MRPSLLSALLLGAFCLPVCLPAQMPDHPTASRLHNGWKLTPAGAYTRIGDMPLDCALSPDGKRLAIVNAGYGDHHLYLVDPFNGKVQQTLPLARAWYGLAWSRDGNTIYVSGGGGPRIHVFTRQTDGSFAAAAPIPLPDLAPNPPEEKDAPPDKSKGQAYVAGLAVSADGKTLYAANFATDTVYALALPEGTVQTKHTFDPGSHPYCVRLAPDGQSLYVTLTPAKSVVVLRADDLSPLRTLSVENHPNALLFAPDGRLFVSCGNSDCVLALDLNSGQVQERLSMALTPGAPPGATPNALAISPDGKTLFVANADNNDVAVVDIARVGHSVVRGFIPTAWYPCLLAVSPDGKNLLIGSGKGLGTGPSKGRHGPSHPGKEDFTYVGDLLYGTLAVVPLPSEERLVAYTRQTLTNTPYKDALRDHPAHAPRGGPIPARRGDPSPIKHILYIIKENHTYDQILGDFKDRSGKPAGNGDPSLCLFGEPITPNIHELARQYVLLDNLYCNGDVSGNGHPWSTGAYATDLGERAWKLDYSDRAAWPLLDPDLFPPSGRIWDECERKGLTYASYYYTWTTTNTHKNMPQKWLDNLNKLRDFENADLFIADLKQYEQNNSLPNFIIMSLREDHTEGTTPGAFTPPAEIASNDLGVGKIVAACSRSKYWKEMAIFIIEDDAQDGPDHVDAHRTEGLVISPYTRRGAVDSDFFTTTSMLRTMELILGLPPMTEYDAAAPPMYSAFMTKPDLTPYDVVPARIDLMIRNSRTAYGADESGKMDFSEPDRLTSAQVVALNHILWHTMKGADCPYPVPTRRLAAPGTGHSGSEEEDGD